MFRARQLNYVMVAFAAPLLVVPFASCNYGPAPVRQPHIDASDAGEQAMELYDTNGDGIVAADELEKSPGLKAALPRLDTNGDKAVGAEEVAERVNAWKAMRTGLTTVRCHITLDGQPLIGAKVVFEPEPFLGDAIKTAVGVTNPFGDVGLSVPPEDRPSPDLPGGAHFGLYKVRISKIENGKEILPARYNTETVLGQEVSYDDPAMKSQNMAFALKSKP